MQIPFRNWWMHKTIHRSASMSIRRTHKPSPKNILQNQDQTNNPSGIKMKFQPFLHKLQVKKEQYIQKLQELYDILIYLECHILGEPNPNIFEIQIIKPKHTLEIKITH